MNHSARKMTLCKLTLLTLFTMMLLVNLSACAPAEDEPNDFDLSMAMIDVAIEAEPQQINPGDQVTIKATVSLDGETIDADKVIFEVWEDGHKDLSENIPGTAEGNGLYTLTRTFEHDGIYLVTSHVDYGAVHRMPTLRLIVGDVPGEEANQEQLQEEGTMSDMDDM